MTQKQRLHLLDEIRGFAVVCMVFFHAFYTLYDVFHFSFAGTLLRFFSPAAPWFAGGFILISGISSRLSHSNLKRGFLLLVLAYGITLITLFLKAFGLNEQILFGILHMLAVSILLFALLRPLLDKIPSSVALCVLFALFLVTVRIGEGMIGLPGLYWHLPDTLTKNPFLYPVGIHTIDFYSADYFPVFPWVFLFLAGTYLGRHITDERFLPLLGPHRIPVLSVVGRHSLAIYLAHQPVIYGAAIFFQWLFTR